MALTPPPSAPPAAPPAPGDAPSRANPSNFRALADAFVAWLVVFRGSLAGLVTWLASYVAWQATNVTELAALQQDVQTKSDAAAAAAGSSGSNAAAVATALDTINNRIYPGAFATDPATRPGGGAPQAGDIYFNLAIPSYKAFFGGTWSPINLNAAILAGPGGSSAIGNSSGATTPRPRPVQAKLSRIVHASDACVLDLVADDAAALQDVASFALAKGLPLLLDGTALIKSRIALAGQILGRPGASRIKIAADFVFSSDIDPYNKSAIVTPNRALAYNDSTADVFFMNGVDLEWAYNGAAVSNPSLLLLSNVKGGSIENCTGVTPFGGARCDALIDLYACVKNTALLKVDLRNLTGLPSGGACWVRNITSDGSNPLNVTENITIGRQSFFGTTTGDEALSIFGVHGLVQKVRVCEKTRISSLPSTQKHSTLASTFPLNDGSANGVYAAVKDVLWHDVDFFSDNFSDHVYRVGRTEDAANRTERVRAVECRFHARQSEVRTSYVARNVSGALGGNNDLVRCYFTTEGTPQQITYGANGFDLAEGCRTSGNFSRGVENIKLLQNSPGIQSDGVGARNCQRAFNNVIVAAANGMLFEGTDGYLASGNDITLSASSGTVAAMLVNSVAGSAPTLEAVNNTFRLNNPSASCINTAAVPGSTRALINRSYGTGLSVVGTLAEHQGNMWFGLPEGVPRPTETVLAGANITLPVAAVQTARQDTNVAANFTVTLPPQSAGTQIGDRCEIVRTAAAGGSADIIVTSSPGTALAVNTAARFEFFGSVWRCMGKYPAS